MIIIYNQPLYLPYKSGDLQYWCWGFCCMYCRGTVWRICIFFLRFGVLQKRSRIFCDQEKCQRKQKMYSLLFFYIHPFLGLTIIFVLSPILNLTPHQNEYMRVHANWEKWKGGKSYFNVEGWSCKSFVHLF